MLENSKNKFFAALAVIGLLIFLHYTEIITPLENYTAALLNPLLGSLSQTGSQIKLVYSRQTDKRDLAKMISDLQAENQQLINENASLHELQKENDELRNSLNFFDKQEKHYLISEIISREDIFDISTQNKIIILNKGLSDGVVGGLAVVNSRGVVIGKILEARGKTSIACLTIDNKCKFAATIQNLNRTSGIAEGDLGLTVKMKFIPQTEKVSKGDLVVTSGLEENIPRGLVIGKINQVNKENNDLWQEALIDPVFDYNNIVFASVVMP